MTTSINSRGWPPKQTIKYWDSRTKRKSWRLKSATTKPITTKKSMFSEANWKLIILKNFRHSKELISTLWKKPKDRMSDSEIPSTKETEKSSKLLPKGPSKNKLQMTTFTTWKKTTKPWRIKSSKLSKLAILNSIVLEKISLTSIKPKYKNWWWGKKDKLNALSNK